jgi:hypothetical protein
LSLGWKAQGSLVRRVACPFAALFSPTEVGCDGRQVYYARLVFLKLLRCAPPGRLAAPLTLPVLLDAIRPLFLSPVDAVHRQLQPVCPRPLVQVCNPVANLLP